MSLTHLTSNQFIEQLFPSLSSSQLIETLLKARKMEMSDDSLLLRPDQRKPEAVIRELRAKARSLRAKVDRRMEATRRSGGGKGLEVEILLHHSLLLKHLTTLHAHPSIHTHTLHNMPSTHAHPPPTHSPHTLHQLGFLGWSDWRS